MKKRALALLLGATLVISGSLVGCSNNQDASTSNSSGSTTEEQQVVRWVTINPGADGWEGLTKPILEAFEEETGIRVEAEFYAFNDLFDIIETKSAAGSNDYDVMSVDVTYISKYGNNGYLEPLDAYFSDSEKAEWDDASLQAGIWDGTMYAAPQNTSTQVLFYNQKLLDEAGITVPENDPDNRLTYEQVAALAKEGLEKLDPDGARGLIGFDFQQVSRVYQMNMLPNALGGKNIGDDGFTVDGIINSDAWVTAMTWYQELVNAGIASRGYNADQLGEQFTSGNMLFMVGGTWTPNQMLVDDEIGFAYAPCFEGHEDTVATSTGSWYFGVDSNSTVTDAAAEFVKYMTLGKGNDMWFEINGDIPSRLAKLETLANDPDASGTVKIGAYEAANTAVPRAVTPAFGEYSDILNQTWEDVRNGADVNDALANAVDQLDTAMSAYK